ncbi:MAG: TIGR03013 family PEP-CTERM/XrtA system glycosyltransferase [Methylococcaceae bacterium]|nr:TIGR03013 family PEP-CTERM/XrtA system glycosyltransferase [Methylococcaceae bacterium]
MIRLFRHYISGAYLVLFLLEFAVFGAAFFVGDALRGQIRGIPWGSAENLYGPAVIYTLAMWTSATGIGLYRRTQNTGSVLLLLRIVATFLVGTALMIPVFYLFPAFLRERNVLSYALLSGFFGVLLCRFLFFKLVDRQAIKRRVMVLGAGYRGHMIQDFENRMPDVSFKVIGFLPMGDEPVRVTHDKVIDTRLLLNEYAISHDIDEIVVAPDDRRGGKMAVDEMLDCKMAGVHVVDLLSFFEREAGAIRVDCLHPSWLIFSDGFRISGGRSVVKRLFDVVISLILCALVWPLMLLAAIAIKLEDGLQAPVLYRQLRVGLNWKVFVLVKFRSMQPDAERDGKALWTATNDHRITFVGRVLRKFRIDELPQLFNVLRGDMSFVGPRPERPEFVEKFSESIPYYSERHRVKPGITGWAQLSYPYGANYMDTVEKLQYDLYYVKNYSLFLDLLIMLQTLEVVLWGRGAR